MTDCPLQLVDPLVPGHYRCPLCGWEYRGPTAPRRNCPNLRGVAVGPDVIRRAVLQTIHAWIADGRIDREAELIEGQLDRCLECRHFDGRVCRLRGSPCRRWQRWLERLATGPCDCWKAERVIPGDR